MRTRAARLIRFAKSSAGGGGGPSVPTFVSKSEQAPNTTGVATSQTVVINVPTGLVIGNLLVAIIWSSSSQVMSAGVPTGWTLGSLLTPGSPTNGSSAMICYRYVTGTEAASYTFTLSSGSSFQYNLGGVIYQYAGCSEANPIDVIANTRDNSASTANMVAPAVTPSNSKGLELACYVRANGHAVSSRPSGFTNRSDFGTGPSGGAMDVEEKVLGAGTAGVSTGTATLVLTSADYNLSFHLIIRAKTATYAAFSTSSQDSLTTATAHTYTVTLPAVTHGVLYVVSNTTKIAGTTCTLNGVAMTQVVHLDSSAGSGDVSLYVWRAIAPASGSATIVVTLGGGASAECTAGVVLYAGVNQTTPEGTIGTVTTNSCGSTLAVTASSGAEDKIFSSINDHNNVPTNPTVQAPAKALWLNWCGNNNGGGSSEQAGGTSVTTTWNTVQLSNTAVACAIPVLNG